MMFDCWKNSCQGATVVPTIAMISSTEVEFAPPWMPGMTKCVATLAAVRVGHEEQRDHEEVREHEQEHAALPDAEAAAGGDRDERDGGDRDREVFGDAEVAEREADADELGHDREEVQDEQVADGEEAPEAPEPLDDQPRVPDAGDRAEPDDHLLVDDQHRHEQQQHPQQAGAVVLPGLRVGRDAAGVVVADHHDQPGADDRQQRQRPRAQAVVGLLVLADRPERALDVADVRGVEHEPLARLDAARGVRGRCGGAGSAGVSVGGHRLMPFRAVR